jgi:hypothetical protein
MHAVAQCWKGGIEPAFFRSNIATRFCSNMEGLVEGFSMVLLCVRWTTHKQLGGREKDLEFEAATVRHADK